MYYIIFVLIRYVIKCDVVIVVFAFSGEREFQSLLVIVAVICVPWMLLAKPLLIRRAYKQKMATGTR
jgi:hypothetical protein